ncbi:MAG: YitT family protein [Clostridiales bacterium]|nr:YitT family protein [Clostridiales bacterium]
MKTFREYIWITIGAAMVAFAFSIFFIPNNIAPGGVSGVATLLHALFNWQVGLVMLIINIPIYAISFKKFGRVRVFRSLYATVLMSVIIDYVMVPSSFVNSISSDILLSSIFGGIIMGAGIGLVIRNNATTGGTDMIATLLHGWFPNISMSWVLFGIEFLVILAAGILLEPIMALYAFIAIFISTKVLDFVLVGVNTAKAFIIVSEKSSEIAKIIIEEMERGATILHGQGAFSGDSKNVILCIVRRNQISKLRTIIKTIDEEAFVIVHEVKEVLGEGFSHNV